MEIISLIMKFDGFFTQLLYDPAASEFQISLLVGISDVLSVGSFLVLLLILIKTKQRRRVWLLLALLMALFVEIYVLKELTGRLRPYEVLGFDPISVVAGSSMPSMHSALIVGVMTMFWRWQKVSWWLACLIIGVVGLSRVMVGAHWATDVLAGWFLGGITVLLLIDWYSTPRWQKYVNCLIPKKSLQ